MPTIVYELIILLSQILRFLGLAVLGLGIGWLVLDMLKKTEAWQVQIAVFLGLAGLIIAMTIYTGVAALGGFAAGLGVAILLWGMPKKEKKEEAKK